MLKRTLLTIATSGFGLGFISTLMIHLPAHADTCTALPVLGGQGFEVRKRIDGRPGGILVGNNWNTDFVVPTGIRFNYYAVTITPENDARYDVSVHFKYPNSTSDTVFQNGDVQLARWNAWRMNLQSPTGRQPYQVNLRIGGANGNVYRARVSACRMN